MHYEVSGQGAPVLLIKAHGRRREAVDQEDGRPLPAHFVVHPDLVDDRVRHQITRATLMESGWAWVTKASPIASSGKRWLTRGRVLTVPSATRRIASENSSW